jgi:succinyl-diaminopimelate desuccinylase
LTLKITIITAAASFCTAAAKKKIGILAHLDVVPAGNNWTYPPFKPTVKGDLIIGRGVRDNKAAVVAALAAMYFFKLYGIRLPFDVRLVLGCAEEIGMDDLPHFLEKRPAPDFTFTPDCRFPVCCGEKGMAIVELPLCEVGNGLVSFTGGTVSNAVADLAVAVLENTVLPKKLPSYIEASIENGRLKLTAHGESTHAASPDGSVNAISLLANFMLERGFFPESSEQRRALEFISASTSDNYGRFLDMASEDATGPLTCINGVMRTDSGVLTQNFNIRYPATLDFSTLFERFRAVAAKYGYKPEMIHHSKGYYKNPNGPEIKALTDACAAVLDIDSTPYVIGGGTYSRAFPNAVTFGLENPDEKGVMGKGRGGAHQPDECISYGTIIDAVKIFILSLDNLAKVTD